MKCGKCLFNDGFVYRGKVGCTFNKSHYARLSADCKYDTLRITRLCEELEITVDQYKSLEKTQ